MWNMFFQTCEFDCFNAWIKYFKYMKWYFFNLWNIFQTYLNFREIIFWNIVKFDIFLCNYNVTFHWNYWNMFFEMSEIIWNKWNWLFQMSEILLKFDLNMFFQMSEIRFLKWMDFFSWNLFQCVCKVCLFRCVKPRETGYLLNVKLIFVNMWKLFYSTYLNFRKISFWN